MVQPEGSVSGGLPGGNQLHSGALAQLQEKEERASKRRPVGSWKKPPLKVYQDNFGFAVNAYQPMIDYINKKDCGENPDRDVHLPLLEERCMRKYQSNRPVHGYNNTDIDFFIDKGQKIRDSIRQNDACGISNVTNRTHTNWSMTRKWVQLVKHSTVGDYKKLRGIAAAAREPIREPSVLSQKAAEFEIIPRKIPQSENYRETTPRPNYVDDSSVDFARALDKVNRMENEEATMARKAKIEALDSRFEDAVDKMCNYVNKLTTDNKVSTMISNQWDTKDYMIRSQKRREMDMANMEESVNDLTDVNSGRNKLRGALRSLDDQITSTSDRIRNTQDAGMITDNELKEALNDIRLSRYNSRARSKYQYENDDEEEYLPVENLGLGLQVIEEKVPAKKAPAAPKGPVITDTYANVVARASDMACLTSEMRKISNRSRFVNCYKPAINTGDKTAVIQPTKIEMNIDHMANTLAMDGKMRRRFEVDDELDEPTSNLNSQMKEKYAEHVIHKPVVFPPSNSMRVRRADLRAQSRVTLLGY